MIEGALNAYSVILPLEITRPGGFEYYFAADHQKSEVFTMPTDYSLLMEIEVFDEFLVQEDLEEYKQGNEEQSALVGEEISHLKK